MSQTSLKMPIRAITSNLHARSPPSVPKAEQTYEPHIRHILRHRLLREIFPYSAVCVWVFETFWIYLNLSRFSERSLLQTLALPLRPSTFLATFLIWMFAFVPILLARRDNLNAFPTPAASPSQLLKSAFSKPVTRSLFLLYFASGLSFFMIQQSVARVCHSIEDVHLNIFVKSKKHPFYLNGRFLYTVGSQVFVASMLFMRNVLLDRWVVKWKEPSGKIAQRIVVVSITSLLISLLGLIMYTVVFGLARSLVLPIVLNVPIVQLAVRPFAAHFNRGRWTVLLLFSRRNLAHIWRTFILAFSYVTSMEFAESLFDENVSKPISIASHSASIGTTLVSGAASTSLYFKFFAYRELLEFASENSEAASASRTALFGDQKHNPTLWATFVRESLLLLGYDYQLLLRRGMPAPPPPPAPAPEKPKLPEIPATPLQRKNIFKASAPSPVNAALDALASDGAITQAVETSAEHLPSVFRAAHVPLPHVPRPTLLPATTVVSVHSSSSSVGAAIASRMPRVCKDIIGRIREWWAIERPSKVAERSLPNRELDTLIIESLSYLVSASLTEDQYGVVQRDIPRILESFISFLSAVEEYHNELHAMVPPPVDSPDLSAQERSALAYKTEEISKARDILLTVDDALKNSIMRVIQTFGTRMTAFKFPPKTAEKLQEFVNYAQHAGPRPEDRF